MLVKFEGARYDTWFNPELVTRAVYHPANGTIRIYFPDGEYLSREATKSAAEKYIETISEAGRPVSVEVQNFPESEAPKAQ